MPAGPQEDELPAVHLTSTRQAAAAINELKLIRLPGKATTYMSESVGRCPTSDRDLPSPQILQLKPGAQVMFTVNDSLGGFVNGTLGTVAECEEQEVTVETSEGGRLTVTPHKWEFKAYSKARGPSISPRVVGRYYQIPLMLAWATTIHKSQGKTLERVHIDLGRGAFSAGQLYVALSRSPTLEGITLARPLRRRDLITDERVREYFH
jgi:hypothetical protein